MAGATTQPTHAIRGAIAHCLGDPGSDAHSDAVEHFDDGVLLVSQGKVARVGPADAVLRELPDHVAVSDQRGKLIVPGFIDTHVHYPQTDMIAAHGEQLLEWLDKYTFPTERAFAEAAHAREVADFFLQELLRNGTTSALVLGTVHAKSVDAFFEASEARDMRNAFTTCGVTLI